MAFTLIKRYLPRRCLARNEHVVTYFGAEWGSPEVCRAWGDLVGIIGDELPEPDGQYIGDGRSIPDE